MLSFLIQLIHKKYLIFVSVYDTFFTEIYIVRLIVNENSGKALFLYCNLRHSLHVFKNKKFSRVQLLDLKTRLFFIMTEGFNFVSSSFKK
jgi:hypothetical protein